MEHPEVVVYLEHDGKVLLVDSNGYGPQKPVNGRLFSGLERIRFPTLDEVSNLGVEFEEKMTIEINHSNLAIRVIKGYPKITWPQEWAWKDNVFLDDNIHPIVRESVYRSVHRLVSKVIIKNDFDQILMAKVKRGHFSGLWSLPGGYMDHNEHPSVGCVRETLEELGISILLEDIEPVITQKIFNRDGISFVSFTYQSRWNGDVNKLSLQAEEIEEAKWFSHEKALENAVSFFDTEAIKTITQD